MMKTGYTNIDSIAQMCDDLLMRSHDVKIIVCDQFGNSLLDRQVQLGPLITAMRDNVSTFGSGIHREQLEGFEPSLPAWQANVLGRYTIAAFGLYHYSSIYPANCKSTGSALGGIRTPTSFQLRLTVLEARSDTSAESRSGGTRTPTCQLRRLVPFH
jgi:hypothetical protein